MTRPATRIGVLVVILVGTAHLDAQDVDCNRNGIADELDLLPSEFSLAQPLRVRLDRAPPAFVSGDFDGDGASDLALASGGLLIRRNLGPAMFAAPDEFPIPGIARGEAQSMVAADFDDDGDLDIVLAVRVDNERNLVVLWNDGSGRFERSFDIAGADPPLVAADFNGDGAADLTSRSGADIALFLGQAGKRSLALRETVPRSGDPRHMVATDLDRDGDLDLVTSESEFLVNDGDRFRATALRPWGNWQAGTYLVAADFDGNGWPDLAGAASYQVSVLWNLGEGQFRFRTYFTFFEPGAFHGLAAADMNRDGDPDLVFVRDGNGPEFNVLLHDAAREFSEPVTSSATFRPNGLAVDDWNGDGRPDLATSSIRDRSIYLSLGDLNAFSDDCNGNRRPDECDIADGVDTDCDADGIPDECASPETSDCNRNGIHDACEILHGSSLDCDGNGVPDTCDIAAGRRRDCNENEIPDICEWVADPTADCDLNGVPDDCDIASGAAFDVNRNGVLDSCEDCNRNGIPDPCEMSSGLASDCGGNGILDECEPDCNENGVPDDCDIASGTSADENSSGVPDSCEAVLYPLFYYGFRGPSRIEGTPGDVVPFGVVRTLASFIDNPEQGGVQTWVIGLMITGPCAVVEATTEGTAGALEDAFPPGRRRPLSFEVTEINVTIPWKKNATGAVSAVVLGLVEDVSLEPTTDPHDILRVTAVANLSDDARSCEIVDVDGLSGGQPIENFIMFQGECARPILGRKTYSVVPRSGAARARAARICGTPIFHRGDADDDGSTTIGDGIFVLRYLFSDGPTPGCLEAADADNSGRLQLTDGVFILRYLFQFTTPAPPLPPLPGPTGHPCGPDPDPPGSPGDLGCERYDHC